MLRTLALLAVAFVAIAQSLPVNAGDPQARRICDDVPPHLKSGLGKNSPDDVDPRCPIDDGSSPRPIILPPPPPPCVPDAFTGFCKLEE